MTTKGLIKEINSCLQILEQKDRKKYLLSIVIQCAMSLVDLIGVGILGIVGSLAVRGIQSQGAGNRVTAVIDFLGLSGFSFQRQVAILSVSAVLLLTIKTIFTIYFSRRILFFLGNKSAGISSRIINKSLSQGYLGIRKSNQMEMQYATGGGVTAIALGVLGVTANLIADLSLLAILGLGVFIIDPFSALSSLGLFGAIGVILYFSMNKKARNIGNEMSNLSIKGDSKLFEVIGAYREIYTRNRLRQYVDEISSIKSSFAHQYARQTLLPNISKYIIELSVTVGAMIIAAVEFSIRDASHAAASLALFMAAGSRIAPALLRIQQGTVQIQANLGLAKPTFALLEQINGVSDLGEMNDHIDFEHTNFRSTIKVNNLNFSYPDSNYETISDVSLEIHEGEMIAIVGPSGSGKSTLIDLILGILKPKSGNVLISGIKPSEAIKDWPGAIGYVPQVVNLLNASVKSNLEIGYPTDVIPNERIELALSNAHLSEETIRSNSDIGEHGSKLSGGQRQRVGIARALLMNPRILILDEATSSLDSKTENDITNTLVNMKGKVSLLVVAHRLSTVKSADRIIYLEKGKVIATGNFEELRRKVPDFDTQAKLMGL